MLGQDCYIVRDHNGQALAYVYFEDKPRRRTAAHLLTRDEARRIAANIREVAGSTTRMPDQAETWRQSPICLQNISNYRLQSRF
jgi:hypothetical protein